MQGNHRKQCFAFPKSISRPPLFLIYPISASHCQEMHEHDRAINSTSHSSITEMHLLRSLTETVAFKPASKGEESCVQQNKGLSICLVTPTVLASMTAPPCKGNKISYISQAQVIRVESQASSASANTRLYSLKWCLTCFFKTPLVCSNYLKRHENTMLSFLLGTH